MATEDRRRTNLLAVVALTAALGAGLVACSSTPDPAPQASTTEAPATSAPPTTQDEEADEQIAETALLTADEVPGGPWIEGDDRSDAPGTGLDSAAMEEESEYFNEFAKGAPGAKAPELTDETTGASLQLDVNIVADEEIATTVAGYFADDRFAGCLEDRLLETTSGSSGATMTDVSVEPLVIEPVGDAASAWTVSFTVEQGTQSAAIEGIIAFVQVERGFSNVSLVSEGTLSVEDLQPILDEAADKLTSAQR